jgi:hypothetical protein
MKSVQRGWNQHWQNNVRTRNMLQFFTNVMSLLRLTTFQCISGTWRLRNSNTFLSRVKLCHLIVNSETLGDMLVKRNVQ